MVECRVVLVGESENEDWVCKNNKTGSGVRNISLEKGGGGYRGEEEMGKENRTKCVGPRIVQAELAPWYIYVV